MHKVEITALPDEKNSLSQLKRKIINMEEVPLEWLLKGVTEDNIAYSDVSLDGNILNGEWPNQ